MLFSHMLYSLNDRQQNRTCWEEESSTNPLLNLHAVQHWREMKCTVLWKIGLKAAQKQLFVSVSTEPAIGSTRASLKQLTWETDLWFSCTALQGQAGLCSGASGV